MTDAPTPGELVDGGWLAPVSVFAAVAIGRALQIANGIYHPDSLFWITITLVLAAAAVVVGRPRGFARIDARVVPVIALAGFAAQIAQLYTSPPGLEAHLDSGSLILFQWAVAALAVIGGSLMLGVPRRAKLVQVGALVALHFAIGVLIIRHAPHPQIDVDIFHHDAIAALSAGSNPYGITFRNIYPNGDYYGPGLSVDGRLQFGFPYPPLSLLLAMPGRLLGGDHRYSMLVAVQLAAVLMAFSRPKGFGPMAAALYLTTPRVFFVIEQSWTEPLVVLGLAVVVFAACRNGRAVPWLFGAFVSLKQYLVFALPAAILLIARPLDRRKILSFVGRAAIVGAAVTVPFFLWGPSAFWRSVVALQFHQPFRNDSLSVPAWWASRGHGQPSAFVPFAAMALASALTTWRLPRTPAGFSAALAVTSLAFFAFNKQAFCNYYFFVIGAFCVTLAAWRPPVDAA